MGSKRSANKSARRLDAEAFTSLWTKFKSVRLSALSSVSSLLKNKSRWLARLSPSVWLRLMPFVQSVLLKRVSVVLAKLRSKPKKRWLDKLTNSKLPVRDNLWNVSPLSLLKLRPSVTTSSVLLIAKRKTSKRKEIWSMSVSTSFATTQTLSVPRLPRTQPLNSKIDSTTSRRARKSDKSWRMIDSRSRASSRRSSAKSKTWVLRTNTSMNLLRKRLCEQCLIEEFPNLCQSLNIHKLLIGTQTQPLCLHTF